MNSINLLADIKECARKDPGFREAYTDSLFPLCQMFNSLFRRHELKGKTFQTNDSATDDTIHDMFSVITEIDPTLTESDTTKAQLKNHPKLREFLDHCCTSHHYLLCIKKCGEVPCPKGIWKPTRHPEEVFKKLHQFPDPVPQPDGHYKPFD